MRLVVFVGQIQSPLVVVRRNAGWTAENFRFVEYDDVKWMKQKLMATIRRCGAVDFEIRVDSFDSFDFSGTKKKE